MTRSEIRVKSPSCTARHLLFCDKSCSFGAPFEGSVERTGDCIALQNVTRIDEPILTSRVYLLEVSCFSIFIFMCFYSPYIMSLTSHLFFIFCNDYGLESVVGSCA